MCRFRQRCFRHQLRFLQDGLLPFGNVLTESTVQQAVTAVDLKWNDRIFTPLVTHWLFLGQVISADHSCRATVARLIARRVAQGLSACSSKTGAYCQARMRLPEQFFAIIGRAVGRQLEDQTEDEWFWKGHHVYMFDGTTTLMPDSPENRKAYPPTCRQQPGVGLPLARVGAVLSLACGVVLDVATAKSLSEKNSGRTFWPST